MLPIKAALLAGFTILCSHSQQPERGPRRQGPQPRTALQSVEAARKATGSDIRRIVEMLGPTGDPAPAGWSIRFHDPASPSQLSFLEPGERVAPAPQEYEEGRAPVYFEASRFRVDSPEAFKIADREAASAKVGFDTVDYQLRGLEFSGAPIWTLRLLDADEELVGIIDISAETGKTLRTVWLRRDKETGAIRISDSSTQQDGRNDAENSGAAPQSEPEPKALPSPPGSE